MTTKLTPLFPMSVKPVREGVYLVYSPNCSEGRSLWREGEWKIVNYLYTEDAEHETECSFDCYDGTIIGWRGFTEDQDAKSVDAISTNKIIGEGK